jgi:hypothetical protein
LCPIFRRVSRGVSRDKKEEEGEPQSSSGWLLSLISLF